MHSPDHLSSLLLFSWSCLHTLLPPDRPLSNTLRTREHDFELPRCSLNLHIRSFVINCLNLCIRELAFTYVCIASCNLSAYTFVACKIKLLTYLLTYLLLRMSLSILSSFRMQIHSVSRSPDVIINQSRKWFEKVVEKNKKNDIFDSQCISCRPRITVNEMARFLFFRISTDRILIKTAGHACFIIVWTALYTAYSF